MSVVDVLHLEGSLWSRSRRGQRDAGTWVVAYLVLQIGIPARLVLPGLGGAGRPAVILGLGLLVWWLIAHLSPDLVPLGRQPLRWTLCVFVATVLASYVLGLDRGLRPLESRGAGRYLLGLGSLLGVSLITADGLRDAASLRRVLRWLVGMCTFSAVLGILQFRNIDLAGYIHPPGLIYNQELVGIRLRGGPGFNRVYGTAQHYIEFGVTLAMSLPVALHLALTDAHPRMRRRWWACAVVIAAAIPFSISRAGALGLFVSFVVLCAAWPRRLRVKRILVAVIGVGAFRLVVPGVLGTIKSAFLNFNNDPSILNRRSDYAAVGGYIRDRPYFGRGPGTFAPEIYRVLDNQFLGSVIELGFIGTTALLGIFLGAWCQSRIVRKRAVEEELAHLGQALAASVAVALVASFTFDSLAFPTFAGLFFVVVGLCAALWRHATITHPLDVAARQRGTLVAHATNILRGVRTRDSVVAESTRVEKERGAAGPAPSF